MTVSYFGDVIFDGVTPLPDVSGQHDNLTVVNGEQRMNIAAGGKQSCVIWIGSSEDNTGNAVLHQVSGPGDGVTFELDLSHLSAGVPWNFGLYVNSQKEGIWINHHVALIVSGTPGNQTLEFNWIGDDEDDPYGINDCFIHGWMDFTYNPTAHRFLRLRADAGGYWSFLAGPSLDSMNYLTGDLGDSELHLTAADDGIDFDRAAITGIQTRSQRPLTQMPAYWLILQLFPMGSSSGYAAIPTFRLESGVAPPSNGVKVAGTSGWTAVVPAVAGSSAWGGAAGAVVL